jgi:pyruvate/2-oxoglutarate dehydrogenase complex dihydrolipoamide dehydrogenase (E3) component
MTTMPSSPSLMLPDDRHNRALIAQVHPAGWTNPKPVGRYNLVVLGAGTAGLVSAVGAASLGATVAIVERHLLGGDCLNVGCVPSKALLSAARIAATQRAGRAFGVSGAGEVCVDFAAVMERMRRLRAGLAQHDSAARLQALGIDVFLDDARFVAADAVGVGPATLRFAKCVIATGARAAVPPIPGLDTTEFVTNETVFGLTALPRRLIVVGGGPIGCEMAQAFRRFGSEVTIIGRDRRLLPADDADASAIIERTFLREGITLALGANVVRVGPGVAPSTRVVVYETNGKQQEIVGDELLVATGRAPNVEGLDLAVAGIGTDAGGVVVDDHLRTANRRVYAAGDICSRYKFTHAADAMARIVLQNALFFGRRKAGALTTPWATYTDPEVAHVGLRAAEAAHRGNEVVTLTVPMTEIDRAVLESETEGFARVHVQGSTGKLLGATMVASHAGEMIGELSLAITAGLRVGMLSSTIHPYPTQSEAWKKLGDTWNRTRLTPRVRAISTRLMKWRR